jgi:hypothetical protein
MVSATRTRTHSFKPFGPSQGSIFKVNAKRPLGPGFTHKRLPGLQNPVLFYTAPPKQALRDTLSVVGEQQPKGREKNATTYLAGTSANAAFPDFHIAFTRNHFALRLVPKKPSVLSKGEPNLGAKLNELSIESGRNVEVDLGKGRHVSFVGALSQEMSHGSFLDAAGSFGSGFKPQPYLDYLKTLARLFNSSISSPMPLRIYRNRETLTVVAQPSGSLSVVSVLSREKAIERMEILSGKVADPLVLVHDPGQGLTPVETRFFKGEQLPD